MEPSSDQHSSFSLPTPWGPLSSSGPLTTIVLLLIMFTALIVVLLVRHDQNLDAHRLKASEQIKQDARREAMYGEIVKQQLSEIQQLKAIVNDLRVIVISLVPRYPHQPPGPTPQE